MRLVAEKCFEFDLTRGWPAAVPLLALLGGGRHAMVATAFTEIPFAEATAYAWSQAKVRVVPTSLGAPPFRTGVLGLVSYDQSAPSRAFRVHQALVLDRERGALWLADEETKVPPQHRLPETDVLRLIRRAQGKEVPGEKTPPVLPEPPRIELEPQGTDDAYLEAVKDALAEIKAGRYYQINLLRYFTPKAACLAGPDAREGLLSLLMRNGGPYSAVIDLPDLSVYSFSPERFVAAAPTPAGVVRLETFPVKGTAPRHVDREADRNAAEALLASKKDQAELAMIVDLMRNDLGNVAKAGTVRVPTPVELTSHANVHHLSARVEADMAPGVTLGEVLRAVCPGGSITGAPKKEAMTAIAEKEGRPRGYFMGNIFLLDDGGTFDSSILIRTLVRRGAGAPWEFAAGAGLVAHSDPEAERREIAAKCRVVGEPLQT